jgi:Lipase (class 3)
MAFNPDFEIAEAQSLIAMCSTLEGAATPPYTQVPFPAGWVSLYQSPQMGIFDNVWQLLQETSNPGRYALLIRGTVDETGSIVDDLLSVMVPATGVVLGHSYRFANDPLAGVHLGFALATLVVLWDPTDGILAKMPQLCPRGSEVYIAGHSQGAAIASLVLSSLSNLAPGQDLGHAYKTYVFALPKPGNSHYASEYNAAFADGGMAYCLNNSQDWVPQVPLSLEWIGDVNTPNPVSVFLSNQILLAPVTEAIRMLKDALSVAQRAKHQAQLQHLSQRLHGPSVPATSVAATALEMPPVMATLDFQSCGRPFSLMGVLGKNPCDASDYLWQHHCTTYYNLLMGIPIPQSCPDPPAN